MSSSDLPPLTTTDARAVDRLCETSFGIPVAWLMEAAGWQVARACQGRTLVVCGHGNNGGDGLAAARHLHEWGRLEAVICTDRGRLRGAAAGEAAALEAAGVEIGSAWPADARADTVVDALLGTGLERDPGQPHASWIELVNSSGHPVVAVDVPSGLESDSGRARKPCVRASVTVTLGLPKPGLLTGAGPAAAGQVWVADIGVPRAAYAAVGLQVPPALFSDADLVKLSSA